MIVIREVEGLYEVVSPGRHWEKFESRVRAQAAGLALAHEIQQETGSMPKIISQSPSAPGLVVASAA